MPKTRKPYEGPLEGGLANDILSIPFEGDDGQRTLRERVSSALAAIAKASAELDAINVYLADSPMAAIVARTLMKQLKRRGDPSIRVKSDGTVVLHVAYDTDQRKAPPPPVKKRTGAGNLPLLADLRQQAAELGVEYEDLGRQRRALFERIKAHRAVQDNGPPVRLVDEVTTVRTGDDGGREVIRRRKVPKEADVGVDEFLHRLDTESTAEE